MGEVLALVIACQSRVDGQDNPAIASLYGSIVPAVWSIMLAPRSRGLGTAYTTLHIKYEQEIAELLGVPYEQVTQAARLSVAYYSGETFRPAERIQLDKIVHWDTW